MFGRFGVFAEFERSIIQERVRAGLKRARAQGDTLGRPRIGHEDLIPSCCGNAEGMDGQEQHQDIRIA